MKNIVAAVAAGLMLGGLGLSTASASPIVAPPGIVAGEIETTEVVYRRGHHAREHHRAHRRHHINNRMRHGDPNARNPERPGYAQQRGTTSGGPHY